MANEVLIGLKIGAAVSGSLQAAFGSARLTVQQLGRATDSLTAKQKLLGTELAASIGRGGTGIEKMRRQYDQVGRTLDQLKLKQERLTTSIARGETLKSKRADLRGEAMETVGTAAVLGAPVVQSMRTAIEFKDQTRDIAITGGFDEAEEKRLSDVMRGAAVRWNQTQTEVANGTAVLIAGGISSAQELAAYAPVMAKNATASRASMDDLGSVAIALNDNLKIGANGFDRAMNIMTYAGKRGQFELADQAAWLPKLTPQFAALGVTGERAVAEIAASLQIARRGAGSNDEAANNYQNFLSKLTSPETIKAFKKSGIDLKDAMNNLVEDGFSPAQAMIEIVTKHLGTKAPAAAAQYQKALDIKDDREREIALTRLDEAYKLGALFADQQVLGYVRPALANRGDQADIQKGSMGAAGQGGSDQDWNKRMGSPKEQLKALTINLTELGITVGSVLLPALVDITQAAIPVIQSFAAWAGENPALVKGVVGLVAGLLAGKLAFIGVAYGANLVMAPFVAITTTLTGMSAKWTLLRAAWQAGKFAPLLSALAPLKAAFIGIGTALAATPIGWVIAGIAAIAVAGLLIYKYWEPIKAWTVGFFSGLTEGLKPIGDAFSMAFAPFAPLLSALGVLVQPVIQWFRELFAPVQMSGDALGRAGESGMQFGKTVGAVLAGLMAPLRWILEGIGEIPKAFSGGLGSIAALILNFSPLGLFYRAFAGVMSYFGIELPSRLSDAGGQLMSSLMDGLRSGAQALLGPLWSEVQSGFSGGLAGITGLILNFSPLGLFYRAFAGVMSYFGIELPGKFSEFGGMLVTGLVNGISGMAGSLKDSVVGMGSSIKGWFTGDLEIHSPSRVFMGYGANLSEGAAIGITGQQGLVRKAVLGMAAATAVSLAPLSLATPGVIDGRAATAVALAAPSLATPGVAGGWAGADKAPAPAPLAAPNLTAPGVMGGGGGGGGGGGAGMAVHFSPQITVEGTGDVQGNVQKALQISFVEFERFMQQYQRQQARRSYGGPN